MARCLHGYEQGECLICQVLGDSGGGAGPDRPATGGGRRSRRSERRGGGGRTATAEPVGTAPLPGLGGRRAPTPVPHPESPPGRRRRPLATAGLVAVVVVAVLAATWLLIGAFFAALRIVELAVVAVAAGWVGYRVGHWRGRRER
jgi:hypothetical protein